MSDLGQFEQTMLRGWEDVYHKSQVTFWLLLALQEKSRHMMEIKDFIGSATNKLIVPDDKSLYRALRRLTAGEMIRFTERPGKKGPDYKIYQLTEVGQHVLDAFIERNIINVYFSEPISTLMKKGQH